MQQRLYCVMSVFQHKYHVHVFMDSLSNYSTDESTVDLETKHISLGFLKQKKTQFLLSVVN